MTTTLTILSLRFPGCVLNADGEWWRGEERPPRAAARLLRTPVLRQTCRNQETHKVFRVSESNATWGVSSEHPIVGDALDNPDPKEPVLIKDCFQLIHDSA